MKFAEEISLDVPVPGESLTSDPTNPKPWEQPPEFTDVDSAIKDLFLRITDGSNYLDILELIRMGNPIDELTQVVLFRGFMTGKWNNDLMLLLVEPTMYLFIALAELNGIYDYTVYDGEENDREDEELLALFENDMQRMKPKMNKKAEQVLPGSLLSQMEPAEQATDMGEE
jgi:hypothetical protein